MEQDKLLRQFGLRTYLSKRNTAGPNLADIVFNMPGQATGAATQMRSTSSLFPKESDLLCSPPEHPQMRSDPGGPVSLDPTLFHSSDDTQEIVPSTTHLSSTTHPAAWQLSQPIQLEGQAPEGQAFPLQAGSFMRRSEPGPLLVGRSPPQGALPRNRTGSFSELKTPLGDMQPMLDAGLVTLHLSFPEEISASDPPTAYVDGNRHGNMVAEERHGGHLRETGSRLLPNDGHRTAGSLGTQATTLDSESSVTPPWASPGDTVPMGAEDPGADGDSDEVQKGPQEGGWFQALARKLAAKADIEVCDPFLVCASVLEG